MVTKAAAYNLGPAERLVPLLQLRETGGPLPTGISSVLTTVWLDDQSLRRQKLAGLAVELIRANKRILVLSPAHPDSDELMSLLARTMRAGGLRYKTWISRYEMPVTAQIAQLRQQTPFQQSNLIEVFLLQAFIGQKGSEFTKPFVLSSQ